MRTRRLQAKHRNFLRLRQVRRLTLFHQVQRPGVGVGDLAQPTRQAIVIGMDMGDHQVANVWQANIEHTQVPFEGAQRVGCVPAAIDQQVAIVGAHQVRVDVAERAITQRQGKAPDPWQKLGPLRDCLGGGRLISTAGVGVLGGPERLVNGWRLRHSA